MSIDELRFREWLGHKSHSLRHHVVQSHLTHWIFWRYHICIWCSQQVWAWGPSGFVGRVFYRFGRAARPRGNLNCQIISTTETIFQMLTGTQAFETTIHHDCHTRTQNLTLLYAKVNNEIHKKIVKWKANRLRQRSIKDEHFSPSVRQVERKEHAL